MNQQSRGRAQQAAPLRAKRKCQPAVDTDYLLWRFWARINSRRAFVSAMRRIIFMPGRTTRQ